MSSAKMSGSTGEDPPTNKMYQAYWELKRSLGKSVMGRGDDDCLIANDSDLDTRIGFLQSADGLFDDLMDVLMKYDEALQNIARVEEDLGMALIDFGTKDSTKAGRLMLLGGRALCKVAGKRALMKAETARLYHEVHTFQLKATVDAFQTVSGMERMRSTYRSAMQWLKKESENLDPEDLRKMRRYRRVQGHVKQLKFRFDRSKMTAIEKIDLYLLSRCNLFSQTLVPYRKTFCKISKQNVQCTRAIVKKIPNSLAYKFEFLKQLNVPKPDCPSEPSVVQQTPVEGGEEGLPDSTKNKSNSTLDDKNKLSDTPSDSTDQSDMENSTKISKLVDLDDGKQSSQISDPIEKEADSNQEGLLINVNSGIPEDHNILNITDKKFDYSTELLMIGEASNYSNDLVGLELVDKYTKNSTMFGLYSNTNCNTAKLTYNSESIRDYSIFFADNLEGKCDSTSDTFNCQPAELISGAGDSFRELFKVLGNKHPGNPCNSAVNNLDCHISESARTAASLTPPRSDLTKFFAGNKLKTLSISPANYPNCNPDESTWAGDFCISSPKTFSEKKLSKPRCEFSPSNPNSSPFKFKWSGDSFSDLAKVLDEIVPNNIQTKQTIPNKQHKNVSPLKNPNCIPDESTVIGGSVCDLYKSFGDNKGKSLCDSSPNNLDCKPAGSTGTGVFVNDLYKVVGDNNPSNRSDSSPKNLDFKPVVSACTGELVNDKVFNDNNSSNRSDSSPNNLNCKPAGPMMTCDSVSGLYKLSNDNKPNDRCYSSPNKRNCNLVQLMQTVHSIGDSSKIACENQPQSDSNLTFSSTSLKSAYEELSGLVDSIQAPSIPPPQEEEAKAELQFWNLLSDASSLERGSVQKKKSVHFMGVDERTEEEPPNWETILTEFDPFDGSVYGVSRSTSKRKSAAQTNC